MVTFEDVLAARQRIRGIVAVTPCPLSEPFSELCGARIPMLLQFKKAVALNLAGFSANMPQNPWILFGR